MLTVSEGLGELHDGLCRCLVTIACGMGSEDRCPAGAAALHRVLSCLGATEEMPAQNEMPEAEIKERLVRYVLMLRQVAQSYVVVNKSPEAQAAISDVEKKLGGLLQ